MSDYDDSDDTVEADHEGAHGPRNGATPALAPKKPRLTRLPSPVEMAKEQISRLVRNVENLSEDLLAEVEGPGKHSLEVLEQVVGGLKSARLILTRARDTFDGPGKAMKQKPEAAHDEPNVTTAVTKRRTRRKKK